MYSEIVRFLGSDLRCFSFFSSCSLNCIDSGFNLPPVFCHVIYSELESMTFLKNLNPCKFFCFEDAIFVVLNCRTNRKLGATLAYDYEIQLYSDTMNTISFICRDYC